MIHSKSSFVFLIGILLYTCRIKGQPSINLPSGNTGNYNEPTEMNCTDTSFDISKGYTWSKDSIKVYDNINGDATGTGKYTSSHGTEYFTLVITNTLLNDSGVYRCFHNFNDASGTLNIQAKGTGVGEWKDGQLVVTLTEFYPSSTTVTSVLCKSNVLTGNSTTTAEGEFFKIVWTSTNAQSVDLTDGCDITIESHTTYRIHIDVEDTTTTTTTTTTHPPPTISNTYISSSTEKPSTTEKSTTTTAGYPSRNIIIGASVGGTFILIVFISTIVCCQLKKRNQEKKSDKSDTRMRGGNNSVHSKTMSEAYENNAYKL